MVLEIFIILNYIVYGSVILWAIITQDFIFLLSIVISTIVIFKIHNYFIIRINNFLIINRSRKTIHQSIDIKTFIMLSKKIILKKIKLMEIYKVTLDMLDMN
ncbi:hypothetical protein H477_4580 [[Clostridium] sordellii ATCC 9714]|nr:hypothetical protein H477_4580 [[Clostridium] sordellii ATCC 9714] [Paeniclostridium sordellii ATCC 9714]